MRVHFIYERELPNIMTVRVLCGNIGKHSIYNAALCSCIIDVSVLIDLRFDFRAFLHATVIVDVMCLEYFEPVYNLYNLQWKVL